MLWYNHRAKLHCTVHSTTALWQKPRRNFGCESYITKTPELSYHIVFTLCQTLHQPYTLVQHYPVNPHVGFLFFWAKPILQTYPPIRYLKTPSATREPP